MMKIKNNHIRKIPEKIIDIKYQKKNKKKIIKIIALLMLIPKKKIHFQEINFILGLIERIKSNIII